LQKATILTVCSSIYTCRYFVNKMKLTGSDSMTVGEITQNLGMDEKAVSARLSELGRERIVEMAWVGRNRDNT
jgi:DNA-binding transcriptional regulator GbsR (MarR family)